MYKVGDLVSIKDDFEPVVDLNGIANENNIFKMFKNYIPTPYLLKQLFLPILKLLAASGKESNVLSINLQGVYGTGKTYALFMIESLLKDKKYLDWFIEKVNQSKIDENLKSEILEYIHSISDKKYMSLYVDMNFYIDIPLRDLLLENLGNQLSFEFTNTRVKVALQHLDSLIDEVKYIYEKRLSEVYNMDIDRLKQEILHMSKYGLEKYENINELVLGMKFSKLELPMSSFLDEITKELEKADKHLVLLLDEFTPYLNHKISDRENLIVMLSQLQEVVQFCNRNKNRVTLICAHHTLIEQYKDLLNDTHFSDLYKVMGRFQPSSIESFDFQDMLIKILDIKKEFLSQFINSNINKASIEQLQEVSDITNIDYSKVYPFNPYTVHLLPFISSRMGQEQRTSFKYILESFKKNMDKDAFLNNKLFLIMPYDIFDYFEPIIKNRQDGIYEAYLESWEYAKKFQKGEEVIKMLFILYLAAEYKLGSEEQYKYVENGIPLKRLAIILQEPIYLIQNILEQLTKSNYVFYNEMTGKYSFVAAKRINPNKIQMDIEKESLKLYESIDMQEIIREVNRQLGFPKTIYITSPLERLFYYEICYESQVIDRIKSQINTYHNYLGKVIYIIPDRENESNYCDKFDTVISSEEYKSVASRIILVRINTIYFSYIDYVKTVVIRKKMQNITNDDYTQNFMRQKLKTFDDKFKNGLSRTFAELNLKYFWNDKYTTTSIDKLLKDVDKYIYNQFPEVKIDLFRKASATRLVKHFISEGRYEGKASEVIKLIEQFLEPLGLAKSYPNNGQFSATLTEPGQNLSKSYYIWSYILKYLNEEKKDQTPIKTIFNRFMSEPYGLSEDIVGLYFSVLIKIGKISVVDRSTGEIISSFTEDTLKNLIKSQDTLFSVRDLYKNNPVEYTKLANELAGKRNSNGYNMTADEAASEILNYTNNFLSFAVSFRGKLNDVKINTDFLNEVLNIVNDLMKCKDNPAEFLKRFMEFNGSLVNNHKLEFKDLIAIYNDIDKEYTNIQVGSLLFEKSDTISLYFNSDIQTLLNETKVMFTTFSKDILDKVVFKQLIENIKVILDNYIKFYNKEHTLLNQYRLESYLKWKSSQIYSMLQLVVDEKELDALNVKFDNCSFELTLNNINLSFDRCHTCNYFMGLFEEQKNKIDGLYEENVVIGQYMVDQYIKNGLDYLNQIQSYNNRELNNLMNNSTTDKYSTIVQMKNVLKGKRLVNKNTVTKASQRFIAKIEDLKQVVEKSDVSSNNELINVIVNWIKTNL